MTWKQHNSHRASGDARPVYTYTLMDMDGDARPVYTYTLMDMDGDQYYAAFIVQKDDGYQATVPVRYQIVQPRGQEKASKPYHYTHDTLQEAKDWCIAELWKRRLDKLHP